MVLGGLENGLVNLINNTPEGRFRHAIVCVKDYSDFRNRIERDDVEVIALNKREGTDPNLYLKFYRQFKRLNPAIVHTRNTSGLDALLPAVLAGVPCRIHGEHGRNVSDLHGKSRKYLLLRKLHRPIIDHYIALSRDLECYLTDRVSVPSAAVSQIPNGVDTDLFAPPKHRQRPSGLYPGPIDSETIVIGTVSRLQPVKDPLTLISAFSLLQQSMSEHHRLKLAIVGDGPLMGQAQALIASEGLSDSAWLLGERDDIPDLLKTFDVYAQSSLAEGISNTVLEAMAAGLPVVATRVGGNPETVVDGETGRLLPAGDPHTLASVLADYVSRPNIRMQHGAAGRRRAEEQFSLKTMVERYLRVYEMTLEQKARTSSSTAKLAS